MWKEILGEDIYRTVDDRYCQMLAQNEAELSKQGIQGELFYLYQSNKTYYIGKIPKINFEFFFRFFIQIGICYIENRGINNSYMRMKENLTFNIVEAIIKIPMRCLIREIHECRKRGKLCGKTEQQEYMDYEISFLKNPNYIRKVCRKYPEMLRLLLLKIGQVIEETEEILKKLDKDKSLIEKNILGDSFCQISNLSLGKSDPHLGGNTVAEIEIDDRKKIIYRPSSIEKNEIYFQIYDWLAEGSGLDASHRKFLSFHTHSWEEYVECIPCQNDKEVKNYFFRAGILIFLCYLTYSTDIHGENIISNGEYPEIIDLETMPGYKCRKINPENNSEKKILGDFIEFSVLQTGFLPELYWGKIEEKSFPSGLHSEEIIRTRIKIPVICNPYSSQIEIKHKEGIINMGKSVVRKEKQTINIQEYTNEICAGFNHAYRRGLSQKEEITVLLSKLDEKKSRYLIRHTQQYEMYLNTSFFPEFMKKIENRIYFFYVLKKNKKTEEYNDEIFRSELSALLNLDIPIYYSQIGKEENWNRKIESHIKYLSEDDLFRQIMLIRMSLGCNLPEVNNSCYIKLDRKLKSPFDIAYNLKKIFLKWKFKEKDATFYLSTKFYDDKWNIEIMDMSLYSGIPGLTISFALLALYTGNKTEMQECENLSNEMFNYTDEVSNKIREREFEQTGMFEGEGSIVYGYLILYKILKLPKYLQYAKKHVEIVNDLVLKDENYDLLSGNAGWIIVLLKLYEISKGKKYLDNALMVEKVLWGKRVECSKGVGWICKKEGKILSGMSHGSSGMILAYSYLLKDTGEKIYKEKIFQILKYENSFYSEKEENWRDFRKEIDSYYSTNVWCHGGSGILLSRLALVKLEEFKDNELVKRDIKRGLKCLSKWEEEDRICICHGLTGFYLIYRACEKILGESSYEIEAKKIRKKIISMEKIKIQEYAELSFMAGIGGIMCAICEVDDEIIW